LVQKFKRRSLYGIIRLIMDNYRAVGVVEGWIPVDDMDEVVEAWQHLHDTGLAYQLQGWFGREAQNLIEAKIINK